MKFITTQEYAHRLGVSDATISKKAQGRSIQTLTVAASLPNLIIDPDIQKETAIIGFMNLKGGAGKTTLATHIAIYLSKLGFKTLLIDTDHQNQCRFYLPNQDYNHSIVEVLSEDIGIEEAIYKISTPTYEMDMIYSSYALAIFASDYRRLDGFLEAITKIKSNYDFIIIDTSPNFDMINRNVAVTATHIVIPIIPNKLHIEGVGHQINALDRVAHVPLDRIVGIVPNICDVKHKVGHENQITLLKEEYAEFVFNNFIPNDPFMEKIPNYNENIFDFREKSKSSQALKRFTWELLRRL